MFPFSVRVSHVMGVAVVVGAVFAVSMGARAAAPVDCAAHGGISCLMGADLDGSVLCKDGWKGSSLAYADYCSAKQAYVPFASCDAYYATQHDQDVAETKKELSVSSYASLQKLRLTFQALSSHNVLVPRSCPVTYMGYLPQGKLPWDVCPMYSQKDSSHQSACRCGEGFFASRNTCLTGWEYCRSTFGTSVTWDSYAKKCTCSNLGDIYDASQHRCVSTTSAMRTGTLTALLANSSILSKPVVVVDEKKDVECRTKLGAYASWDVAKRACVCATGFSVVDGTCLSPVAKQEKQIAESFVGAPTSTADLLRCLVVGLNASKTYVLKGDKRIPTMTADGKTCFATVPNAKKAGFGKQAL